jgi:2-hydroxychromene-2-carboxylate isomerase
MKHLDFWFDPISPYAYLAFERLPQALEGLSFSVAYRPVLFAGLLARWGQKGPAEIEPKRIWTYRDVAWRAQAQGTRLELPAQHPFNPLALLRLCLACVAPGGAPNRRDVEVVFRHVWHGGHDANEPARLEALRQTLAPVRDQAGVDVKTELRTLTESAAAQGIFGVPTIVCEGRHFWGADALPMLAAYLRGDRWFAGSAWDAAAVPRGGVQRR